jgi:serine/threonine protein kinase
MTVGNSGLRADAGEQRLGNYRLLSLLNKEDNAITYLGEHVYLGTQVAVNVYQTHLLQNDQDAFLSEVRAIARLIHPHIVRILEFGVERETPFLVTPYTAGCTLRERYSAGSVLPLSMVVSYVKQIASALDYASSTGVLHLDLKPEHLWLRNAGEVLVNNFRVTLLSHNSHSQSVRDIAQAVAYMAPEQIQGHPTAASDQYALALIVYEWLCGSRPFLSTNYIELASQHISTSPPGLVARVPDLSTAVERVVMKALAKNANARFPSTQAFADALEQSFLFPARQPVFRETPAGDSFPDSSTPQKPTTVSRRVVTLGLLGTAGVLAVGSGLCWFSRSSSPTRTKMIAPTKVMPTPTPTPAPRGTTLATYRGHSDLVYAVDWARDSKHIASWSLDDTMQVWSATTFTHLNTLQMARVISWSPDWQYMASGDYYINFQLWNTTTGRILALEEFPFTGSGGEGPPVASRALWSPDGKYFITPEYSAQVWEVATGKVVSTYPTGAAGWSPDSKYIALRRTNKVQILDAATENVLASYTIPAHPSELLLLDVNWSPDGKYIAAADGTVWEALTGKLITRYEGSMQENMFSISIVWSPDSKYIASSITTIAPDGQIKAGSTVHIWSIETGSDVFVYSGHTDVVSFTTWSPDGTKIASASYDTTVKVWQAV